MVLHAMVTFLVNERSLTGVDEDFRGLVELFHKIPFCASFGVSCAGHLRETDAKDGWQSNSFWPSLWGHLNIIVLPEKPHIVDLLGVLQREISRHADTSFKPINHVFGPPQGSQLQVWEIRIGANGCLGRFESRENWFYGPIRKEGNEEVFASSKRRCWEIKRFWKGLEKVVAGFCRKNGFGKFDLDRRIDEIMIFW